MKIVREISDYHQFSESERATLAIFKLGSTLDVVEFNITDERICNILSWLCAYKLDLPIEVSELQKELLHRSLSAI